MSVSGVINPGPAIMSSVSTTVTTERNGRKVIEHNYTLPKGAHSNLVGSYSYTATNAKVGRLKGRISMERSKLKRLESQNKLNLKKKRSIQCKIKYLECQLNKEMSLLPLTKVNVYEKEDDKEEN